MPGLPADAQARPIRKGAVIGARTPQRQTYFAARLPHGFWVLCALCASMAAVVLVLFRMRRGP